MIVALRCHDKARELLQLPSLLRAEDGSLDRFEAVISSREERLLPYLAEPRTLEDIAEHRFVYRPGDDVLFAEAVERTSMSQHLTRLEGTGRVVQTAPGTFRAAP